jgi:flagellar hook-associated protein 3 FlgL
MMRITTFMLFNQFANSLNKNLSKLGIVQQQLSSGKRLTKTSDDVIAARGAMAYKVSLSEIEQFNRNIDQGISTIAISENKMRAATDIINRVRELSVSESSDTSTAETRRITSFEVQNLYNELLDIANTKVQDKYIFSGFLTDTQPFNSSGSYVGDTGALEIFTGDGIKTRINITGDTAFSDNTKYVSADLTGETLSGNIRITAGSGTPLYLDTADVFSSATPEEIRDTINAPMSGSYDSTVPETVGTGTLTLQAGTGSPVTLTVTNANDEPSQIRDAINALNMGIEAGIFTDAAGNERLFFRPTTPGDAFSIEVSDSDGDDTDMTGLSALSHTYLKSNLTSNALGIEAFVINDSTSKRLLFAPNVPNTSYTIEVDENNNGNFADAADIDTAAPDGLALLYHASSATTNLNNSISFFSVVDHFKNSLVNNDAAGIRGSIFLLDGVIDSLVSTTADAGSRYKYLENQKNQLLDTEVAYRGSLAVLEDADIAKSAMEMTKIQSSLEAMRISSVKSLSQSLFDFLG